MIAERESNPREEARSLRNLLRAGETPESVYALIGNDTPYRRRVRLYFDIAIGQKPDSEELKQEIIRCFRSCWAEARIRSALHVSPDIILHLRKNFHE